MATKTKKKSSASRSSSTKKRPAAAKAAKAITTRDAGLEELAAAGQPPEAAPEKAAVKHQPGGFVNAYPILMVGAAGAAVAELAYLLELAGYDNAIAAGEAEPILDDALMRTVIAFQKAKGIDPWSATSKDAENPPLLGRDQSGIVDAYTWAALLGAKPAVTRADLVADAYATEGAVAGRKAAV